MHSWPDIYVPPVSADFPNLSLFSTYQKTLKYVDSSETINIYVCGITPYDATHCGHAATYISFDLIHRYLKCSGKTVNFIENITDIDDPLLERASRDSIDWQELAMSQIDLFRSDMTALHVLPPSYYIGAIESMSEVFKQIKIFNSKGLTYELDGDLYLSIAECEGTIVNLPHDLTESLRIFKERGGDPDRVGKKHPLDTLLWLKARAGEPSWDSPFGAGRPGWHIECAAIALKYATENRDSVLTIQGGGSDLIFPHHYMSAVQGKSLTGREFAHIYSHTGMIGLDGEKMSKSKGNLVFVSKLLADGVDPVTIRVGLMREHYRTDRMWSGAGLASAEEDVARIRKALSREVVAPSVPLIEKIVVALSKDLDTPEVFKLINQWCSDTENGGEGGSAGEVARALDALLGLTF